MTSDRRSFLKQAVATFAVTSMVPGLSGASPSGSRGALDERLLSALGDATLPESLGAKGRARAVEAFREWLAAYRPVAERAHGYGSAAITYTPADPGPGWNAQLAELDLLARKAHGAGFAEITVGQRRAVLRTPLENVRFPRTPGTASHVAVALLAHWAAASETIDLAYRARIGTQTRRPLSDNPRKPLPLAGD